MARLSSSLELPNVPAEQAWQLVTDWPAHSRWIPLTAVTIDPDSPVSTGLGTRFTGRTAIGPVGFDDPMTVTGWQPPLDGTAGRCRVVKRGRWLAGWAEIEVQPTGTGCRLMWTEDIWPRWTPKAATPVVIKVGTVLFDRTLRKVATELA
ncbi:MAG: SRPBCC family protein [Jatrophihabitantaceae bacterium]